VGVGPGVTTSIGGEVGFVKNEIYRSRRVRYDGNAKDGKYEAWMPRAGVSSRARAYVKGRMPEDVLHEDKRSVRLLGIWRREWVREFMLWVVVCLLLVAITDIADGVE